MPEAYQATVPDQYAPARDHLEMVIDQLSSRTARRMTHSEAENLIQEEGWEVLRLLLQGYIDTHGLGETDGQVQDADGMVRTHRPKAGRNLMSQFGLVRLQERQGYGARGESALYPLDGKLNLPKGGFSFGVRKRVATEASKVSFDETVESVNSTTGAHVAKRQAEQLVVLAAEDFEEFYDQRAAPTESPGEILVLTFDQKGVVMRPEGLRDATRKAAEKRVRTYESRLTPGQKQNAKRMASVAAVYTTKPYERTPEEVLPKGPKAVDRTAKRPRPENKRVWASLAQGSSDVIEEGFEEALKRDPEKRKDWVALVDGNKDQIRFIQQCVRQFGTSVTIILDFIHVLEYLWGAAHAIHGKGAPMAERWVRDRGLEILRGNAGYVAGGIRRAATLRGLKGPRRKAVDKCAKYLLNNKRYLRYHEYLAVGYPIATGVIEGACRHLIKDRMDITGARWGLRRAEAVLRLRALRSSGDFDEYWIFHEAQEQQRNHCCKYHRGALPKLVDPMARTSLRLVHDRSANCQ